MLSYFLTKYILCPLFRQNNKTLTSLLQEFEVPILVFADADYLQTAAPFNLRLSYKPEVIALPQTVAQVRTLSNPDQGVWRIDRGVIGTRRDQMCTENIHEGCCTLWWS